MEITSIPKHEYYGYLKYSTSYEERGDFTIPYIIDEWQWRCILSPKVTITKHNWKCKACHEKILDDAQIVTPESHNPAYHVNCWKVLYERALDAITENAKNMLHQIDEVELTPCHNARDVQSEY